MTKLAEHSCRGTRGAMRTARALPLLVACCLALLQLANALHFALVPHDFNAHLDGFVHVEAAPGAAAVTPPQHPSKRAALVSGVLSCAPESCPVGFAGLLSACFAQAALSSLIALPPALAITAREPAAVGRNRVLLGAPKTSPPVRV